MNLSRKQFGIALTFVLAACASEPAKETAAVPQLDPATLHATVTEFVSTWNAGEAGSLGASVADDAVLMQPDGPVLQGREAILRGISEGYDPSLFQQSFTLDEVTAVGAMAYARGTWTLNPTAAAGSEVSELSGLWSAIYKRGPDGGWQTWRWMWNQPSGQTVGAAATE
jgi:ketosteroid isomerase-like protein